MKIIIASDSYKGSLSSLEVAQSIKKGVLDVFADSTFEIIAMADGGEGSVEAIISSVGGQYIDVACVNALNEPITSRYGILENGHAIIEMASASGLPLVKEKKILEANTYGTGLLIKDALDHHCSTIYLGIGGSATNDGGIGMANALGVRFLDEINQELTCQAKNLQHIQTIDLSHLDPRIKDTTIIVMCDVTNPLCGPTGASAIYGPQKGANQKDIAFLDQGLHHLAAICQKQGLGDLKDVPGAGAAGGLGFGLMAFCQGKLQSGIETVLEIAHFENKLKDCDLVITGEGRIDNQSIYGKVPTGVAKIAQKYNIPTVAIVGSIGEQVDKVYQYIQTIESCVDYPCQLEEALKNASINVYHASVRLMKAIQLGMSLR